MADNGEPKRSDGRHDNAIIRHGRAAAEARRAGNAEGERVHGRIVRHLVSKSNRDNPPQPGGPKGRR